MTILSAADELRIESSNALRGEEQWAPWQRLKGVNKSGPKRTSDDRSSASPRRGRDFDVAEQAGTAPTPLQQLCHGKGQMPSLAIAGI